MPGVSNNDEVKTLAQKISLLVSICPLRGCFFTILFPLCVSRAQLQQIANTDDKSMNPQTLK